MTDTPNKPAQYAVGALPLGDELGLKILPGNLPRGWRGETYRDPESGRIGRKPSGFRHVHALNAPDPLAEPLHKFSGSNVSVDLRHDGHEVHHVLSTVPIPNLQRTTDGAAQWRLTVREHQGWIPKNRCPTDMIARGEVHESRIVAREILTWEPHKGPRDEADPCRCYRAERDARRARHAAENAAREAEFRATETAAKRAEAEATAEVTARAMESAMSRLMERIQPAESPKSKK